eukprot:766407-Hanusia_phi.AAC.8
MAKAKWKTRRTRMLAMLAMLMTSRHRLTEAFLVPSQSFPARSFLSGSSHGGYERCGNRGLRAERLGISSEQRGAGSSALTRCRASLCKYGAMDDVILSASGRSPQGLSRRDFVVGTSFLALSAPQLALADAPAWSVEDVVVPEDLSEDKTQLWRRLKEGNLEKMKQKIESPDIYYPS